MAPELIVLDVAHGNCTLLIGENTAVVIDAPRGGTHIDTLKARSIHEVHAVVVSHADADHVGGIAHLLYDKDIRVHRVYVNADATKTADGDGTVWENFARAVADAVDRGEVKMFGVKRGDNICLNDQLIHLEVLAPAVDRVLLSAGGRDDGQRLTSNTLSVVVRVLFGDEPMALLTADLTYSGFKKLRQVDDELHARVLVFPHHGGHSGGNDRAFASAITKAVEPEIVIFSIGRGPDNPQPEIVAGILSAKPNVAIMCTQLSKRCSSEASFPPYIGPLPAKGRHEGKCCAGSLQFGVSGLETPTLTDHAAFVDSLSPLPLCRSSLPAECHLSD